jgi:hypothetical protein
MVVRALFLSAVPSGSWYPRLVIGPKRIAAPHNVCVWHKADIQAVSRQDAPDPFFGTPGL